MGFRRGTLKRFIELLVRENIHRILLAILLVMLFGSMALLFFERELLLKDAVWWSIVTMSTVGYGDISPASAGGRVVAIIVMLLGIGLLGVLTASIATIFVEKRLLENRGMKPVRVKGHFLICGWNFRGEHIVAELRADAKSRKSPIVVIADIPEKPVDDPALHFIRGEIGAPLLGRANLEKAAGVIVLSDDRLDAYSRDAKTILSVMTLKNLAPTVYTCVELMDPRNVDHCQMAKADEIVVAGELSTNMLVQATLDHGISRMVSELVSNRFGNELFKITVPPGYEGRTFFDTLCDLKRDYDIICLGVEDRTGAHLLANPESGYLLKADDRLVVISENRPDFSK
ncbi:MAG: ion channel [Pseudomonadales bacterium]|nr:ion channel [Pseudomonadales bacterium]